MLDYPQLRADGATTLHGAAARTLVRDRADFPADRISPMGAAARGPRVKSSRPRDLPAVQAAPIKIFAPADRA